MPQLIGVIVGLFVVIEVLRWVLQWLWACFTWVWEVFLMPLVVYALPSTFILTLLMSLYVGGAISASNYLHCLFKNVDLEGPIGGLVRNYIFFCLSLTTVSLYLGVGGYVAFVVKSPLLTFIDYVVHHYETIRFPAYTIRSLFG